MKRELKKRPYYGHWREGLYHNFDCEQTDGPTKEMSGQQPNLYGNCSYLTGDWTNLCGNCSGLLGGGTGIRGDCTGIYGHLNLCYITEDERAKGIDINDLINEENENDND